MSNEKIKTIKEVAKIDTSYNGRSSHIGLYVKEGQFGQFFSIEKHGEDMPAKYLSMTLNPDALKEIGEKLIAFADSVQKK